MDSKIRQVRPTDLPDIIKIEEQSFSDPYPERLLKSLATFYSSTFLVAETKKKVVGYASAIMENGGSAHLLSIAVDPIYRQQKIAKKLLGALVQLLRDKAALRLRLEVRENNVLALGLYEALGFRRRRTVKSYYQDGTNATRMELEL
ncbi:MAG: ribosomal protein S18-alanine N-acetyltransferase [Candidatus Bathyarchaeia archaeon]